MIKECKYELWKNEGISNELNQHLYNLMIGAIVTVDICLQILESCLLEYRGTASPFHCRGSEDRLSAMFGIPRTPR